jgi:tetratricopeptide (TPR) repeat protein
MAGKKRVTRKQLLKEPDKVITMTGRAFALFQEYRRQITLGLGIFIAVLLVTAGVRYAMVRSERAAFTSLDQAMQAYASSLAAKGASEALADSREAFDRLVEERSGTRAGKLATLMFANICYAGGDTTRAAALFEKAAGFFEGSPQLEGLALGGLAYSYAALAEIDKALDGFGRIVSNPAYVAKADALYQQGGLYAIKGEAEKSREAFERIVTDYQGSLYYAIAREKSRSAL